MTQIRSILLVDADPAAIQAISANAGKTPLIFARTSQEAYNALTDKNVVLSGIFVSPKLQEPNGLKIIRLAHEWRIGTPLYVIQDGNEKPCFDSHELEQLAVQGIVHKPLSYEDITRLVAPLVEGFDPTKLIAPAAAPAPAPVKTATEVRTDEDFVPILAQNFLSGKNIFFDLFLRLDSGRFMKIVRAGDEFNPTRLEAYFRKGVDRFYIRKEIQFQYLAYCDQLAEAVLKRSDVPIEVQAAITLNLGQETLSFLKSQEVLHLEYAVHFIEMLTTFVRKTELSEQPDIQLFMRNLPAYEHGVSCAMVGSLLAREFGLTSERVQRVIGLACLFHDLSLAGTPEIEKRAKEGKLSIEEKKLYESHPLESARLLALKAPHVESIVVESVAQHHERISGHGFPQGLRTGQITRIAEIVGICDEFVGLIEAIRLDPKSDPITGMWDDVLPRYSNSIATAFMAAFF